MKWIMVANSNDCKIFKYDKNIHKISFVAEISHPENRLREKELVADTYGMYQNIGMRRGSYEPETTHVELAMDNFAREMASRLDAARIKKLYDDLILLMPSAMGGKLFKHLNKHVLSKVRKVIQKNLVNLSEYELKEYLSEHLKYVGMLH